jgi:hypothetical protein
VPCTFTTVVTNFVPPGANEVIQSRVFSLMSSFSKASGFPPLHGWRRPA